MFFVISGFLISASFERSNNVSSYFIKRAFRIYPALWLCILITIPVIYVVGKINFFNYQTIPWLFSQFVGVIYTPEFLKGYGFGSYNGSLWTIPVELQFYVLIPIVYWIGSKLLAGKTTTLVIASLFVAFVIMAYLFTASYPAEGVSGETTIQKLIRYSFVPHFYLFLFGVLLRRLTVHSSPFIEGKGLWWTIAFIATSFVMPLTPASGIVLKLMLGVTTISLAYTLTGLSHRILRGNDISYGVYIFHGLVIGVFVELGLRDSYGYAVAVYVTSCLLAWASWTYLENPILKLKHTKISGASSLARFFGSTVANR